MKKLFFVTLMLIAGSIQAAEPTRREQLCDLEEKLSIKESRTYRQSLIWGSIVDHYKNIESTVEPLLVKARVLVKNNCLQGKPSSEISSQLTSLWTDGCKDIGNPTLNPLCKAFQALNDGTNIAKLTSEIPSLAALLAEQAGADCTAGVSDGTIIPDKSDADELSNVIEQFNADSR